MSEMKRGDKRAAAIEVMKGFGPGHVFEECIAKIIAAVWPGEEMTSKDGDARAYYRYISKQKLIPGFVASTPTRRKPVKKDKSEETSGSTDTVATTETSAEPVKAPAKKGGNPKNLAKLKEIGRRRKLTKQEATEAVEAMAEAGLHHAKAA